MSSLLKVIVKPNPFQAKLQKFIDLIAPIYETFPERSRYNRRCRQMPHFLDAIRQELLDRWVSAAPDFEIIDSAPVVIASGHRSRQAKLFASIADKGRNVAKSNYYYGFKFHAVITSESYLVNWELSPAPTDG